jgi:formylglycine-generating enzyme required for sulfatase activity
VAQVLISYVIYLSQINPGQRLGELQAQRWAAMSYLGDESCQQMVREIAERFEMSAGQGEATAVKAEFARLARITQELESQLQEHLGLVEFAKRVGRSLRSPQTLTPQERWQVFEVGDRTLRLPDAMLPSSETEDLPGLQTFEFDVAEFVETVEGRRTSRLEQISHEFQVATIEFQMQQEQRKFWQRSQAEPKPKIVIHREDRLGVQYLESLTENLLLELVKIPAGSFVMGAPEDELESFEGERPQHEVTVPEFYMGKYPVTQAQWRFVADLPQVEREIEPNPSNFKGDDLPVEQVSWLDATEFCARLSQHTGRDYRLPSEAEWEYACRAGTTTPFHFGETIDAEIANYQAEDEKIGETVYPGKYSRGQFGEYRKKTTPVGSFGVANHFGLYDMHGNVWEWCLDHWHESYEGAPVNGSAWIDLEAEENAGRLLRGGSWYNKPRDCRSAGRIRIDASYRSDSFGFRVCSAARILP